MNEKKKKNYDILPEDFEGEDYTVWVWQMKLYCITWKDERWSADKEDLKGINDLISKNSIKKKSLFSSINPQTILLFFMYLLGCVYHGVILCFKWLKSKLNSNNDKKRSN